MRLTAIKMAGFKSFVDPVTVSFPDNMTAIVGPNGCGKSNIIDAARWVMGESSARQLRGESMSDVIFSGSSQRKPVGMASVELLFDNSDGGAGGEYANYNEIAVRRQVSRDGASSYFLNGTRCRRKDITDLFLGTGLGPRSYSIIEQGMISQIVEARPEELRNHLEEAAGISRYRERRRETENRIRHTRENLERLSDLREEVGKHLQKLQSQARAAERYKKLQQQSRDLQASVQARQLHNLRLELTQVKASGDADELQLQQAVAEQRRNEAAQEMLREQQSKAQEHVNSVQAQVYEIGAAMARLEQSIKHQQELRQRQEQELQELEQRSQQYEHLHATDAQRLQELRQQLQEQEPQLHAQQQQGTRLNDEFQQLEQCCAEQQQKINAQQRDSADQRQQNEVLLTRIAAVKEQQQRDQKQLQELQQESGAINTTTMQEQIVSAQTQVDHSAGQLKQLHAQHEHNQQALQQARAQQQQIVDELRACQDNSSQNKAHLQSLLALQQAAMGEDRAALQQWLQDHGLDQFPRLASVIDSDAHWSRAVEIVLGDLLQALLTDSCSDHQTALLQASRDIVDDELMLLQSTAFDPTTALPADSLAAQVKAPAVIMQVLAQVRCVDDLDTALQQQAQLEPGQSLITAAGEWVTADWVRIAHSDNPAAGSLQRQQNIRELEQKLAESQQQQATLQQRLDAARQQLQQAEQQLEQSRQQSNSAHASHSEETARLHSLQERQEVLGKRQQQLIRQSEDLQARLQQAQQTQTEFEQQVKTLTTGLEQASQQQQQLLSEQQQLTAKRDAAAQALREHAQQERELAVRIESARASLASLERAMQRGQSQVDEAKQRQQQLREQLSSVAQPGQQEAEQLEQHGQEQMQTQQRLKDARIRVDELSTQLQEAGRHRQQAQQSAEALHEQVSERKLQLQSLQIKSDNLAAAIHDLLPGADIDELIQQLSDDFDLQEASDQLDRLQQRITRMEPINLAAIGEFEQEQQRKAYLDNQNDDLVQALETLEQAIARIDRTTRTRFRDTFEEINKQMEILFPRLFGGGHAYLELTGDDWLTAGVAIMARPPGKRNSSLHLLSGGEKAMTAVALVFSIFSLNPAPFCLLDEVDAPLDDANVDRFSSLVKEMSERVQFLVVTHNKATMEMAGQLCGVTMREAGVSRLVSVDIEQASKLAAAG